MLLPMAFLVLLLPDLFLLLSGNPSSVLSPPVLQSCVAGLSDRILDFRCSRRFPFFSDVSSSLSPSRLASPFSAVITFTSRRSSSPSAGSCLSFSSSSSTREKMVVSTPSLLASTIESVIAWKADESSPLPMYRIRAPTSTKKRTTSTAPPTPIAIVVVASPSQSLQVSPRPPKCPSSHKLHRGPLYPGAHWREALVPPAQDALPVNAHVRTVKECALWRQKPGRSGSISSVAPGKEQSVISTLGIS